ncbi:MAG: ribonuclease E/G [Parvibaculales bacterium]
MNELIFKQIEGRIIMARCVNGDLCELIVESLAPTDKDAAQTGLIYLGFVERVVPNLQAAFVDIGQDRAGFLGAREAKILAENPEPETNIEDCVAAGDTVLVQVTRPASGEKGASLTANVTLPGRHLVLAPCSSRIAVSRSIEDEAERQRLADLAEAARAELNIDGLDGPAGWVLRTVAEGVSAEILKEDMQQVAAGWDAVLDKADAHEPPYLVHQDVGGIAKLLRDHVQSQTQKIIIEGGDLAQAAQDYMQQNMANQLDLIEAAQDEDIFERHDIYAQIEKARAPRVNLASGAWLMIETTQAMTTIDVNSGAQNSSAFEVNLDAANHIAREIRLRAIGGLIAIDFIDMDAGTNSEPIIEALLAGFDDDKVPVRIGDMSDFGVVEMTRKRERQPLSKALSFMD